MQAAPEASTEPVQPVTDNQMDRIVPDKKDAVSALVSTEIPAPEPAQSIWPRLISLYALPQRQHRSIRQEIRWLKHHPDYLQRVQIRATPFLPYILQEIEARQMPGEIALLPIVESAFQPHAYSHKHAAGVWQFIPATGKRYGLKQNWWYDGRMDINASTRSALDYLNALYERFDHDWLTAIAAYNCGGAKVARAIRKNRSRGRKTDFWSLRLPRETRAYVPRLLAMSHLFAHPERYDVERRPIPVATDLTQVQLPGQTDLAIVANLADMPLHQLYRLNPGYKRWSTGPDTPRTLLIPLNKVEQLQQTLTEQPPENLLQIAPHTVAVNETLGHIAEQYNVRTSDIRHFNKLSGNEIHTGATLQVPIPILAHSEYEDALALASALPVEAETHRQQNNTGLQYKIRPGDTIWDIARMFSISMSALAEHNRLKPGHSLYPGQKLAIPFTADTTAYSDRQAFHYTVRKGDSLHLIAQRFNVSIADLRRWNIGVMGKYLQPGQKLAVYEPDSVS